jgi:protein-S-isoprenylcysteine O-methyltransferase Ste14
MESRKETHTDAPQVVAPPPIIYLSGLATGIILHLIKPIPLLTQNISLPIGTTFVFVGILLVTKSFRALRNANTNIDVRKPSMSIVTNGPYRFSRNPIYLAMTILAVGIAVLVNSLWILITLVLVLLVIQFGVIKREEAYLTQKFGEEYLRYKTLVRRWI